MLRRLIPLVLLLPLFFAPVEAQDAPRAVEVRIVALCRGYMRPMKATADRIAKVEGIESCEMLGFGGDTARYKVTTRLDDEALAKALQLNILGSGEGFLTLAISESARARRAEARGVVTQIALAISRQPKPSWNTEKAPLFDEDDSVLEHMERLDLSPELLKGTFYKPADYHIEEDWGYGDGTYRIWAGDRDESVRVPTEDWWGDEPDAEGPREVDPDSRFVGIRIYRSAWSNSMTWVDAEGLLLDGEVGDRSETDDEGVLYVKQGADWMQEIMSLIVAALVRDPKQSIDRLPRGRGWTIFQRLDRDNPKLDRRSVRNYDRGSLALSWREDGAAKIANMRAHHPAHAFYLELEVDATAVVEDYKKRVETEDLDLKSVEEADIEGHVTWIHGAEESVEVFRAREREAAANFEVLREALKTASQQHALKELCGTLDDAELRKRLGVEETLKVENFNYADYTIAPQMLGDVEISVGSVLTGGRNWMLVNAASGNVIRRTR